MVKDVPSIDRSEQTLPHFPFRASELPQSDPLTSLETNVIALLATFSFGARFYTEAEPEKHKFPEAHWGSRRSLPCPQADVSENNYWGLQPQADYFAVQRAKNK